MVVNVEEYIKKDNEKLKRAISHFTNAAKVNLAIYFTEDNKEALEMSKKARELAGWLEELKTYREEQALEKEKNQG